MLQAVVNWLFRPQGRAAPPGEATAAHDSDLASRLARLESQQTTVMLQWTETLDKLQAWTNRQNARDAKRTQLGLARLADAPDSHEEPAGGPIPAGGHQNPGDVKNALRRRLQAQNGR